MRRFDRAGARARARGGGIHPPPVGDEATLSAASVIGRYDEFAAGRGEAFGVDEQFCRSCAVEKAHARPIAQQRLGAEQHRRDADAAGDNCYVARGLGEIEAVTERTDDVQPIAAAQFAELARAFTGYKEEKACALAFCFVDGERRCSRFTAWRNGHDILPGARRLRQQRCVE
jgi:hypothetical protein